MRRMTWVPFVLVLAGLAGCDSISTPSGPSPDDAVASLTTALAGGDFSEVAFTASTPEQVMASYDDVVTGLGGITPSVSAGRVSTDGDRASVPLTWTWPLEDTEWTYDSRADLAVVGGEWRVVWDPSVVEPSLRGAMTLDAVTMTPARGDITGAQGRAIVTDRPVVRLGIDRTLIGPTKVVDSARKLATLLDIDVAAYAKEVRASGAKAFVEAITYRRGEVPPVVGRGYRTIPGALGVADDVPLAPTRDFAAPILGAVGEVTAEMVDDDPETYRAGDVAGLSGLQARYDDQLRGQPGVIVDSVRPDGTQKELFRSEAQPGTPLRLSLDVGLQRQAEDLLADVGPASALVAIRPSTGDIVAAANGPGTDGYNIATYGQLAPGSTFKSVSTLALLRAGLRPDSDVPCTSQIVVDGKPFENYDDYPAAAVGDIALRTAVANSCNTAFISQADRVQGAGLSDAAASLGLGIDHDLGLPAYFGSVEQPTTATERAADMIGQGTILASPMAMAAVIASIQHGSLVVPRMVDGVDVGPPDGAEPLGRTEGTQLKAMLRGVVTDGSGAGLADLPGPPAIAKTGTAEFERDGKVLTHAWMIAAQGDLAVAAFVDVGDSGSGTAGPILEAFLRAAR